MAQLSESNIPFRERLVRISTSAAAGCEQAELTDVEVALSVFDGTYYRFVRG